MKMEPFQRMRLRPCLAHSHKASPACPEHSLPTHLACLEVAQTTLLSQQESLPAPRPISSGTNTGSVFCAERGRWEVPLLGSRLQSQHDRKDLPSAGVKQEVLPPKSCAEQTTNPGHTCVAARTVFWPPPGQMAGLGLTTRWTLAGLGSSSETLTGRGSGVCTGVTLFIFSGRGTTEVKVWGCFFFLRVSPLKRHRKQMHRRRSTARSTRPSREPRTMPAMAVGPRVGPAW